MEYQQTAPGVSLLVLVMAATMANVFTFLLPSSRILCRMGRSPNLIWLLLVPLIGPLLFVWFVAFRRSSQGVYMKKNYSGLNGAARALLMRRDRALLVQLVIFIAFVPSLAFAQAYGEDAPWQFQSPSQLAALTSAEAMIQLKRSGGYGPASSTTTVNNATSIGQQTNCNMVTSAYGNNGTASASAGSPVTSGATTTATGSSSATSSTASGTGTGGSSTTANTQTNSGEVASSSLGGTSVSTTGPYYQALNSTQTNGGTQTASVAGSSACSGVTVSGSTGSTGSLN
jgi:hypothetical protein